jgi:hypothetical protein
VASFTMAKVWDKPRCPSTDECIKNKNVVYKHTRVLFSHKEE